MKTPKRPGGQHVHFTTTNGALAFALFSAGIPLLQIWNCYTAAALEKIGARSVKDARENGKRGKVFFVFERSETQARFVNIWDEQAAKVDAGEALSVKNATPDEFMRIACHLLKQRSDFMELWKKVPGRFIESNGDPTTTEHDGQTIVLSPGFKMATENLPAKQRKAIGL